MEPGEGKTRALRVRKLSLEWHDTFEERLTEAGLIDGRNAVRKEF
jgi:hypothetical protein